MRAAEKRKKRRKGKRSERDLETKSALAPGFNRGGGGEDEKSSHLIRIGRKKGKKEKKRTRPHGPIWSPL